MLITELPYAGRLRIALWSLGKSWSRWGGIRHCPWHTVVHHAVKYLGDIAKARAQPPAVNTCVSP